MQQWYVCPRCRQYVQWGTPQCIYCGCPINWGPTQPLWQPAQPPPPPPVPPPPPPPRMPGRPFATPGQLQCPHCGRMINLDSAQLLDANTRAQSLAGAQTRVRPPVREPQQSSNGRSKAKGNLFIVLCVVVLLAIVGYLAYTLVFSPGAMFSKSFGSIQSLFNPASQSHPSGATVQSPSAPASPSTNP